MKYTIFILVLMLGFGCATDREKLAWEAEESEIISDLIRADAREIMSEFHEAYTENPGKVQPWISEAKLIAERAENLTSFLDSATNTSSKTDSLTAFRTFISEHIRFYTDKFGKKNEGLFTAMTSIYPLDSKHLASQKTYSKQAVVLSKKWILEHLFSNVNYGCGFRFNRISVETEPLGKTIRTGEYFRANIFLASTDTTKRYYYKIGNTEFYTDTSTGFANYREKAPLQVGKVRREGIEFHKNPAGEDTLRYPFELEYEVVK